MFTDLYIFYDCFLLQWQLNSVAETVWPAKPNIFIMWLSTGNIGTLCYISLKSRANYNSALSGTSVFVDDVISILSCKGLSGPEYILLVRSSLTPSLVIHEFKDVDVLESFFLAPFSVLIL